MWPFKTKYWREFNRKYTPKFFAQSELDAIKMDIEDHPNIRQVKLNVATDKLRKYLGESSKIYYSFSLIDINVDEPLKSERRKDAAELLSEAISIIDIDGLYEDLNTMLIKQNLTESKRKTWATVGGAIGGAILTNVKDIIHQILVWIHLS